MPKISNISFEVSEAVKALGAHIRIARVRRRLRQEALAEKCGISRKTLYGIEKGLPGSAIGNIYTVLWALGLLDSTRSVAEPDMDEHGKILEAAKLPKRIRESFDIDNDF